MDSGLMGTVLSLGALAALSACSPKGATETKVGKLSDHLPRLAGLVKAEPAAVARGASVAAGAASLNPFTLKTYLDSADGAGKSSLCKVGSSLATSLDSVKRADLNFLKFSKLADAKKLALGDQLTFGYTELSIQETLEKSYLTRLKFKVVRTESGSVSSLHAFSCSLDSNTKQWRQDTMLSYEGSALVGGVPTHAVMQQVTRDGHKVKVEGTLEKYHWLGSKTLKLFETESQSGAASPTTLYNKSRLDQTSVSLTFQRSQYSKNAQGAFVGSGAPNQTLGGNLISSYNPLGFDLVSVWARVVSEAANEVFGSPSDSVPAVEEESMPTDNDFTFGPEQGWDCKSPTGAFDKRSVSFGDPNLMLAMAENTAKSKIGPELPESCNAAPASE